ncbi:Aromatic-L-amino-acid decarboxylase [Fasciolopsis buskii]|uniref:Aromatic-L-amino-acid decarboxylase n=1 Tax=Fasciolopsis buskii TaxID=27845 RepID=A0A8E0RKD6_9TREM|nr:Aromatic-L-amino-acid decarboxylase [Fasciolopsis buski]
MDSKQLTSGLHDLSTFISHYWSTLKSRQVGVLPDRSKITPGYLLPLLPNKAPENSEELQSILNDVRDKILPGVTHWHHPNFHAYFPTACSSPAILGDVLASAIAPVGFTWIACPASTELEVIVLDWLARAMDLPEKFLFSDSNKGKAHFGGGTIECSASLACATLTMGLRDRKLNELKREWNSENDARLRGKGPGALVDRMIVYLSDQAHSSVPRACHVAMIRCHMIKTVTTGRQRIFESSALSEAIEEDIKNGFLPLLCVATLGTTNTCEFDNIAEIGKVCNERGIWFHVDAAYAGAALLCPEYRHFARGLELADSFCFNPHKLMLVNFDCSVLWLHDHRVLSEAFREDPVYLRDACDTMPEFRNWSINLGRRFRSLKIWFVLRMFGLEGIRKLIRQHAALAKRFESLLAKDDRFEIVNDVRFGLVCFRLKASEGDNAKTMALQEALLRQNRIYLVAGSVPSNNSESATLYFLRFVGNLQTAMEDVDFAYSVLNETTTEVLKQSDF